MRKSPVEWKKGGHTLKLLVNFKIGSGRYLPNVTSDRVVADAKAIDRILSE